jgi:hypothetical protein
MQQKQKKQGSTTTQNESKGSDINTKPWGKEGRTPTYRPTSALTPEEKAERMARARKGVDILLGRQK